MSDKPHNFSEAQAAESGQGALQGFSEAIQKGHEYFLMMIEKARRNEWGSEQEKEELILWFRRLMERVKNDDSMLYSYCLQFLQLALEGNASYADTEVRRGLAMERFILAQGTTRAQLEDWIQRCTADGKMTRYEFVEGLFGIESAVTVDRPRSSQ